MTAISAIAGTTPHATRAPELGRPAQRLNHPPEAPRPEWSEQDLVLLHCGLLAELSRLARPETPLEDKLDTIQWVFSDKESAPFSFVSCLRVAGSSPLSTFPYVGKVDAEEIRERIRHELRAWLRQTLERYPPWIGETLFDNPEWVAEQLAKNPQCINEKVRLLEVQADLFL